MDVTTQRRCLVLLACGLLAGGVGVGVWSIAAIDDPAGTQPNRDPAPTVAMESDTGQAAPAAVAAVSLRGPLYDPPPPQRRVQRPKPVVPPPKPKATLDFTLVGTVIDSDSKLAILADPSGKFDVKGPGETLELAPSGVTVGNIESERVTLHYQGEETSVQLDRRIRTKAGGGNRQNNRRRNNR